MTNKVSANADVIADPAGLVDAERGHCEDEAHFLFKGEPGKDCLSWAPNKRNCHRRVPDTGLPVMHFCPSVCKDECKDKPHMGVVPSTFDGSYTIGPYYAKDAALEPCSGNSCERGEVFNLFLPTKDSAYYNCDMDDNPSLSTNCARSCLEDAVKPGYRKVSVYVPAAYNDGDETGLMVMQDGEIENPLDNYGDDSSFKDISNVMDNFIDSEDDNRSLPIFILIAVEVAGVGTIRGTMMGNPCARSRDLGSERYNEYTTVSGKYASFISNEVLPFVTNHRDVKSKYPNLKVTDDAAGRATWGISDGAATAFKMAFFRPDLFGISIGYSMAIVSHAGIANKLTSDEEYPLRFAEFWVDPPEGQALIMKQAKKAIRVFHNSNENDYGTGHGCTGVPNFHFPNNPGLTSTMAKNKYDNIVEANNKTFAALSAMGYATRYAYGLNACHVDLNLMYQDIPNSLVWAWDAWKKKQQRKATSTKTADSAEL
eukprot:CAMPEP_0170775334 /NCGR_PEP_ID=MMETSP0733-20121128/10526_1 /TAXON_ID=186038 /ORGANISM="Fragilariopsis kerguelensis, Strain L26-C5" /LENGTH=483 /DNA_ID=CAMNT_0011118131 /DNA_START=201 /DNA_END=1652 /DNA_ORIENTATION=-